jgi:hypothetical protein
LSRDIQDVDQNHAAGDGLADNNSHPVSSRIKRRAKTDAVPYQLVKIKWEDSAHPISAWQWIEDYELPQTVTCISVGYLIAETKEALALAPNLGDVGRERIQASGIIRIPLSAVRAWLILA